jgi:hypothetical protein
MQCLDSDLMCAVTNQNWSFYKVNNKLFLVGMAKTNQVRTGENLKVYPLWMSNICVVSKHFN